MSNTKDMNNPPLHKEESKSGVGDDLRAAPFTDQVFDDDYYGCLLYTSDAADE